MASVMRILGWKAEGLRCPDHEINCLDSSGEPFSVSLIQMPNGTGKTTTLALLRAALSGEAADGGWDRQETLKYQKRNSSSPEGCFEVRLMLNDKRATILMEFDFESGSVSYKTTYGSGQRSEFYSPPGFQHFMNKDFVKFYVFDGELAAQLLDREHTRAQVVVERLFQMNTFDEMKRSVDRYWISETQGVGATEERGLTRRRNFLDNLKNHLRECESEKQGLEERLADLEAQLEKKQDRYRQEIEKNEDRSKALEDAKAKADSLKEKVREKSLNLLDRMREPHALSPSFAISMLTFKDALDKVKLPESAAREFFEDLADGRECVCGRTIDEEVAEMIRSRSANYLGTDDVALLNSLKTTIKEAVGNSVDTAEKDLNEELADLETAVKEKREAENYSASLSREAEKDDPDVKKASDDIENLCSQVRDFESKLEKFEGKYDPPKSKRRNEVGEIERTYGIKNLEEWVEAAGEDLAEITNTINLKERCKAITEVIERALHKAHTGITQELCEQANTRISELMPNNNISIERIDKNLILKGQEGGSVGENLSIAYAFLSTIFNNSDHQLPFIVDSPAGPIDLAIRPKIGEIVPQLTGQFIAFTISTERSGFITHLKQASNAKIQFITLFRKGIQDIEQDDREKGEFLETEDGLNVTGEDFFNNFQIEEDEAT